jgi:hypothetical protein
MAEREILALNTDTNRAGAPKTADGDTYIFPRPVNCNNQAMTNININSGVGAFTSLATNVLAFPATQVPSADPNTLDDYEEGDWTPVLSDGTNDATSSVAVGTYEKMGRKIHVKGRLNISSLVSVSGDLRINGLPFISSAVVNTFSTCSFGHALNFAIVAGTHVTGYIAANTSHIFIRNWDSSTGTSALQHSEWTASGLAIFDAIYYI